MPNSYTHLSKPVKKHTLGRPQNAALKAKINDE
jgi:hypothetical protein